MDVTLELGDLAISRDRLLDAMNTLLERGAVRAIGFQLAQPDPARGPLRNAIWLDGHLNSWAPRWALDRRRRRDRLRDDVQRLLDAHAPLLSGYFPGAGAVVVLADELRTHPDPWAHDGRWNGRFWHPDGRLSV